MKLRLAWLADPVDADSYSAREARVLLRALARNSDLVPLWFAVGGTDPPHFWNGVRVFPIPSESLQTTEFLQTLVEQQRPHILLSNLPHSSFPTGWESLRTKGLAWWVRVNPDDLQSECKPEAATTLLGDERVRDRYPDAIFVPYLRGLDPTVRAGADPATVLDRLQELIHRSDPAQAVAALRHPTHLVMRQQLFCNSSLAHVMFELTSALIELGLPTVPQEEHSIFSKGFIHREEELFRTGAPEKYRRIQSASQKQHDPENAVTVHFGLFKSNLRYARHAVFPSLAGREVLYTTGNHTVTPEQVRQLAESFDMIIAPSRHVLRPYLEAGLSRRRGAVVPHGVDPAVFSPEATPFRYPTAKGFKFLQTSFPWVYEKGFDLTVKAFGQAFSKRDGVALILRVPRLQHAEERNVTFGRLKSLVQEECARLGAPEILLLEQDVPLNERGGVYTGADCYVHPLRAEGFGMTILEAMACALPVIATPWSGPADFLSPRYAYTLRHSGPVAEKDPNGAVLRYHVEPELEHLVHFMRYVYEHQDEAKRLARRAARVVGHEWTWKRAAASLAAAVGLP